MLKLLKKLSAKDIVALLVSLGLIVVQVWLDLTLPDYMSEITSLVQSATTEMKDILIAGAKMMGCAFGSLLAAVLTSIISAKVGTSFSARLREEVYSKVQSFSLEEMSEFSTASLITRTTNDITQIQNFVIMGFQVLFKAPIMAIWAIIKILGKNWEWSVATAVAIVLLAAIVITCIAIAVPQNKKIQTLTDNLNRVTRENLTGLKVVRAYNAEDYEENKFHKCNEDLTKANTIANKALSFMTPTIQATMNGLTLAIYWIGATLINNAASADRLSLFSDMIVFSSYAIQVVMAFMMLVMAFIMLPRAFVSAKRINEVLDKKLAITDGAGAKPDPSVQGQIEFKHIDFSYPGAAEAVLKDITFSANKGETVAFIGSTGCGKSTIVNLIPRFYDATSGEIKVDGENVKDYKLQDLRDKIGYVSQRAILFKGSVRSNIAFGDNADSEKGDDNVGKALQISKGDEFVNTMEGKNNAYIAQTGSNLSGGQKQRISIARAIARKPEILIFDDSFSALDYKTDREVRENIKTSCQGITTLIVAQRIGTIRDADKIIVLEDGKIVGEGTHDSLMKDCKVYQEIALSQLSKEELA